MVSRVCQIVDMESNGKLPYTAENVAICFSFRSYCDAERKEATYSMCVSSSILFIRFVFKIVIIDIYINKLFGHCISIRALQKLARNYTVRLRSNCFKSFKQNKYRSFYVIFTCSLWIQSAGMARFVHF